MDNAVKKRVQDCAFSFPVTAQEYWNIAGTALSNEQWADTAYGALPYHLLSGGVGKERGGAL